MASAFPRSYPSAARSDAIPPSGLGPGGDLDFMRQQHLDEWGIDWAVLNPYAFMGVPNARYASALARAANDLTLEEWLYPEPRFCSSLLVSWDDPKAAVAEIDRLGDHERFVQVGGWIRTSQPLGKPQYWPIYEAAVAHGLPVGLHFGGNSISPTSGCGQPSFYAEEKAGAAIGAQDQIASLIFEGVFDAFPTLRVVLIETGFGFFPSLMWRLDRGWQMLASEIPDLERVPSEYIRDHFWVTTQPIEEPPNDVQFLELIEQMGMDDRIMFSSDYPHWDFDSPARALPRTVPPDLRRRILGGNASELYQLGGDKEKS